MESYSKFKDRINSFEVPSFGIDAHNFIPSNSVKQKITSDRDFKPFYGDTIVFDLSDEDKRKVFYFVDRLYESIPDCFSKKLYEKTMHLTLHDLINSPNLESIHSQMTANHSAIRGIIDRERISYDTIKMRSNYIINMMNTSVVMCFFPIDEIEYEKIIRLYSMVDEVFSLPYPFIPHVTLAYFNPNGFDESLAQRLTDCVNSLNKHSVDITLTTDKLVYQRFSSMNSYMNFLRFVE